jgi:hypothetical protein
MTEREQAIMKLIEREAAKLEREGAPTPAMIVRDIAKKIRKQILEQLAEQLGSDEPTLQTPPNAE